MFSQVRDLVILAELHVSTHVVEPEEHSKWATFRTLNACLVHSLKPC